MVKFDCNNMDAKGPSHKSLHARLTLYRFEPSQTLQHQGPLELESRLPFLVNNKFNTS